MKGTVGTKMMSNIENTNPKITSASQERRQPGSHVSKRKKGEMSLLFTITVQVEN